jgi:gamma-glutamyltranspeptidase
MVTLFVFLSTALSLPSQDRSYGRSVVATQYGMVATSQVSASQAGALILERGGSAIDAAIAANTVLNVTEPTSNGMGCDLFAFYGEAKTGTIHRLNEHIAFGIMSGLNQPLAHAQFVSNVVDQHMNIQAAWKNRVLLIASSSAVES